MNVLTFCEVWAARGRRMEPISKAVRMKLSALGMISLGMIYENDLSYLWQSVYWYIHVLVFKCSSTMIDKHYSLTWIYIK